MKSVININSLFLQQKTLSPSADIRFPVVMRIMGVFLLLLSGASCTTLVPVDNNRPSAATRLEIQQKIFEQAKTLFLNQQYAQASKALLLLAEQGHASAQYTIGYMYHYGYGLPRNKRKSVRWITIAAARGHPQAEAALAKINAFHDQHDVLVEPPQTPK